VEEEEEYATRLLLIDLLLPFLVSFIEMKANMEEKAEVEQVEEVDGVDLRLFLRPCLLFEVV
jgi:hypothetical protein